MLHKLKCWIKQNWLLGKTLSAYMDYCDLGIARTALSLPKRKQVNNGNHLVQFEGCESKQKTKHNKLNEN